MYSIKETNQDLHRGILSDYVLKVNETSKEIDQELRRELLLIFLIASAWKQQGYRPGAPQMTSAHRPHETCMTLVRKWTRVATEDICLYS